MRRRRSKVRVTRLLERRLSRLVAERIADALKRPVIDKAYAPTLDEMKILCERLVGKKLLSFERGSDGVYRAVLEPEPPFRTFTFTFSRETGETTSEALCPTDP